MTEEIIVKVGVAVVLICYMVSVAWKMTKLYCNSETGEARRIVCGICAMLMLTMVYSYTRVSVITPLFWASYADKFYALRQEAAGADAPADLTEAWAETYAQMLDSASNNAWVDQDYVQAFYEAEFAP